VMPPILQVQKISHIIAEMETNIIRILKFSWWSKFILQCSELQEEAKRRLNSGNACYHSVQNIFFFLSAV
jgi:hypothetical protein